MLSKSIFRISLSKHYEIDYASTEPFHFISLQVHLRNISAIIMLKRTEKQIENQINNLQDS